MIQKISRQDTIVAINLSSHLQRRFTIKNPQLSSSETKYNGRNQVNRGNSQMSWHCHIPSPTDEYYLQLKMKEKFQELYKRIQKISRSINADELKFAMERNIKDLQRQNSMKKLRINKKNSIRQHLIRLRFRTKESTSKTKQKTSISKQNLSLQVSTSSQFKQRQMLPTIKILNYAKLKPHLKIIKNIDMSNKIEDYLSIEKIELKNIQKQILQREQYQIKKKNQLKVTQSLLDHQTFNPQMQTCILQTVNSQLSSYLIGQHRLNIRKSQSVKLNKKFIPPFQTYSYRDLLWRVAYSNQYNLNFPETYPYKIKFYVGSGNNSKLVKNIINRRSWFQITDKVEQANFVWTQIKYESVFVSQSKQYRNKIKNSCKECTEIYLPKSIWTNLEEKEFQKYFSTSKNAESRMSESMKFRNKNVRKVWKIEQKKQNQSQSVIIKQEQKDTVEIKLHNHLINSYIVGNKKALFQTMTDYYTSRGDNVFKYLPLTFHICNGLQDQNYLKFLNYFYAFAKKQGYTNQNLKYNAWIVKPGENSNRGQGITVCLTLHQIKKIINQKTRNLQGKNRTYIVQKYIERPLLYKRRKFDLRHYIMVNCSNGFMKGYWFNEGYVRTTSSEYTLKQNFGSVHLTNDAVQKHLPDYGKYEKGNKISYDELNDYLVKNNYKLNFWNDAFPKMKAVATDVIRACAPHLDPDKRTNFEIFGLDFMLDENLSVWLIEVNTNPCLELSCPLLAKIIPKMIENTLQICLDPLIPPPVNFIPKSNIFKKDCIEQMGYELIYDQRFQQANTSTILQINDETLKKEVDDCFEDDGDDWNDD